MLVSRRAARAMIVRGTAARGSPSSRAMRLDRPAHQELVEETSPPASRLVLDRDPVRELALGMVEVAPVPRGGQAALLAGVLDQPIRLESHELHLELHLAAKHPEDERGSVARLAPAPRRGDPHQARPVLGPVVGIGDVVEAVVDRDGETVLNLDANRSGHGAAFGGSFMSLVLRRCTILPHSPDRLRGVGGEEA